MHIPFRYATSSKTKIVCKLEQVLYGLKQSPRAWFGNFSSTIRKYGYHQSNSDHTFFQKHQGKVTTLIVYVDDMIITRDDVEEISRLQEHLATEFEMKNLGAKVFSRNRGGKITKRHIPISKEICIGSTIRRGTIGVQTGGYSNCSES